MGELDGLMRSFYKAVFVNSDSVAEQLSILPALQTAVGSAVLMGESDDQHQELEDEEQSLREQTFTVIVIQVDSKFAPGM